MPCAGIIHDPARLTGAFMIFLTIVFVAARHFLWFGQLSFLLRVVFRAGTGLGRLILRTGGALSHFHLLDRGLTKDRILVSNHDTPRASRLPCGKQQMARCRSPMAARPVLAGSVRVARLPGSDGGLNIR